MLTDIGWRGKRQHRKEKANKSKESWICSLQPNCDNEKLVLIVDRTLVTGQVF